MEELEFKNEIWKDIIGYEGLYKVSNLGRVKSLNYWGRGYEAILKPLNDGMGYLTVGLSKDSKRIRFKIHRLVAIAFIPNPNSKPCVDHIDTNKANNTFDNLRWVTYKENMNNPITVINVSNSRVGKHHSEETKKKISESLKKVGDEVVA